ncbi:MAG: system protein [Chlamydiales bacterium]|jgi:PTS system nitrogen regulatory IIA component|nr:system protein [Chlamydiales bacterium]
MKKIVDYLKEELVCFLTAATHEEAIAALVDKLDEQNILQNRESFQQAILERERLISTGIGMGVAIPHAKLPIQQDFFVAIGIQKHGIEWQAIDGLPVTIIFMVGGSEMQQTQYLQLLSKITMAIKDENRRKKMLQLNSAKEIVKLFQGV